MNLEACIEAMLFAAAKPFTVRRLAELLSSDVKSVETAVEALSMRLVDQRSGLQLLRHGSEVELVTHPECAELVRQVVKDEVSGELSKPSLEALAILAYRGPMTRPELEQIRGVQSALILRNLMLRGLVEMKEDVRLGQPLYAVTGDFLKHIGVDRAESLPEYASLHGHTAVLDVLQELESQKPSDKKEGEDPSTPAVAV